MNFVKFLKTSFLQNTSKQLLLKFCFLGQICFSENNSRFNLLLFVSNLWSIAFLKTAWVMFSCSFVESFQETITSMTESVFNKVCYVAKFKLHPRYLMSKFSEILMLACRKIFSAFYPVLHKTFSSSCGFPLRPSFFKFPS